MSHLFMHIKIYSLVHQVIKHMRFLACHEETVECIVQRIYTAQAMQLFLSLNFLHLYIFFFFFFYDERNILGIYRKL